MSVALVVPTCRPESLTAFLDAWQADRFWDRLYVVEDDPRPSFLARDARHLSHADAAELVGRDAWVISKRDSAIRCLGFLAAYRDGADLIVTLDDDCFPVEGQDYLAGHRAALFATPRWESSIPGFRVRGLPYGDLGTLPDVMLNVGLWTGVPDVDAASQLVRGTRGDFTPPDGSRVLARGRYTPLCGMNLAFRREFAPLAYFPLMGEGWPYRRLDDIWFGVIAKRVCDHLGWSIALGRPWVRHARASDPMMNIRKEAPGYAANETFWRAVDSIPLTGRTPAVCVAEVGRALEVNRDDYLKALGRALQVWAGLFV